MEERVGKPWTRTGTDGAGRTMRRGSGVTGRCDGCGETIQHKDYSFSVLLQESLRFLSMTNASTFTTNLNIRGNGPPLLRVRH
jgi:hypothetical protein